MSGSKSGEIGFDAVGMAAGVVGAGAVLVAGAAIAGVIAAVEAYKAMRERIERERQDAMSEQQAGLIKIQDTLLEKMRSRADVTSILPQKTYREKMTDRVKPSDEYSSLKAADDLKDMLPKTVEVPVPEKPPVNVDEEECRELIESIKDTLKKVKITLPQTVVDMMNEMSREQDIKKVAAIGRSIRLKIDDEIKHENERIQLEQREAQRILDSLPHDFPQELRQVLTRVVEGKGTLDSDLRQLISDTIIKLEKERQQAAEKILTSTLTQMGYEVGLVGESIFSQNGRLYFRKSNWDDGYCVKLNINNNKVQFNMMKSSERDRDADLSAERAWETDFNDVKKGLNDNGIKINHVKVNLKPGVSSVNIDPAIPIDTTKKPELQGDATGEEKKRAAQFK